jgi:2-keto-3-deoxy-L-rhamnonate aldolase RhmA
MRENSVKRTLASGGTAVGLMALELGTLGSARLADSAGADFVIWDMEHTGWTTETVRQVMAAARLGRAWPLVRVPRAHYHLIATALDAGAMGVMVPMVETAEQARLVVDAVKYPPVGRRGYGAVYPDMTPDGPAGWMEASNRETLVIVQIETVQGLENADAIIGTRSSQPPGSTVSGSASTTWPAAWASRVSSSTRSSRAPSRRCSRRRPGPASRSDGS